MSMAQGDAVEVGRRRGRQRGSQPAAQLARRLVGARQRAVDQSACREEEQTRGPQDALQPDARRAVDARGRRSARVRRYRRGHRRAERECASETRHRALRASSFGARSGHDLHSTARRGLRSGRAVGGQVGVVVTDGGRAESLEDLEAVGRSEVAAPNVPASPVLIRELEDGLPVGVLGKAVAMKARLREVWQREALGVLDLLQMRKQLLCASQRRSSSDSAPSSGAISSGADTMDRPSYRVYQTPSLRYKNVRNAPLRRFVGQAAPISRYAVSKTDRPKDSTSRRDTGRHGSSRSSRGP